MKASNLIEVTLDGQVVAGTGRADLSAVSICTGGASLARSTLRDRTVQDDPALIAYYYNYNGFAEIQEEGERMADVLGDKQILMLANHGVVTTGETVAEAYHRLYFLKRAAMMLSLP